MLVIIALPSNIKTVCLNRHVVSILFNHQFQTSEQFCLANFLTLTVIFALLNHHSSSSTRKGKLRVASDKMSFQTKQNVSFMLATLLMKKAKTPPHHKPLCLSMPCKNNDRLKDVKSAIFQVLMHCMCLVTCHFNSVVRFTVNLGYTKFESSFLLTTPALTSCLQSFSQCL